jgi:hypothetical protein
MSYLPFSLDYVLLGPERVCRPGNDPDCDMDEVCDGMSPECPPNDAPFNQGNACGDATDDTCTDPDTCDDMGNCESNDAPNDTPCTEQAAMCFGVPAGTAVPNACLDGECALAFSAGGDTDMDGICNAFDNCVDVPNPGQSDVNNDGVGDLCEPAPAPALSPWGLTFAGLLLGAVAFLAMRRRRTT